MAKKRWTKKNVFQGSQCPEVIHNCPGTINLENLLGGEDYFVCSRNSTHMIKATELADDSDDAPVEEAATEKPP